MNLKVEPWMARTPYRPGREELPAKAEGEAAAVAEAEATHP